MPIAMAFTDILTATVYFLIVSALSFAALCLLVSYLRFETLAHGGTLPHQQIGDREKLRLRLAQRLATRHRTPEPFSLLLVQHQDGPDSNGAALEHGVSSVLRRDDDWVGSCEGQVAVLLEAPASHVPAICRRISEALQGKAEIGAANFPEHAEGALELIAYAEAQRAVLGEAGQGDRKDAVSMDEPLTGIVQADRFPLAVQKYIARYRRSNHPVAVVYIDIDNLDRYATHYGGETREEIVRLFGDLIQDHFRATDLLGMYAEDEFVAVLPCEPAHALGAAQRVAAAIKKHPLKCGQATLKITISAGVAGYPDHGRVPKRLLDCAFAALETAQQRGQNLCLAYQPNMRATVHGAREADIF